MSVSKPKPKHWAEWVLLRGIIALIRQGEMTAAYGKALWLANVGRRIFKSEWAWANANLAMIYGANLTSEQRDRLTDMAFENIFYSYMEAIRVQDIQFQDEHKERLQAAHAMGRGVIVCGVHIGCWEPGLIRLGSIASPASILYRHANNPLSEKTFIKLRSGYGVEWISRRNTREVVRAIQDKKVLGFMTDINTRDGGITAPYLGVPAQCPPGPARLALRYKCILVPIIATREGLGKAIFRVGEPIEPQAGGENAERIMALTAQINESFVPWIHEYAEQYNWLHARWRARPDGTLWRPEDAIHANPYPATPSERVLRLLRQEV